MPTTLKPQPAPHRIEGLIPAAGGKRPTLDVRFVTRMSRSLNASIAACAHQEGITAGAWVRQRLLAAVGLQSALDGHSGRPTRRPAEDVVAISTAIRELAAVNNALAMGDGAAARASLDRVRAILIPMVVHVPTR